MSVNRLYFLLLDLTIGGNGGEAEVYRLLFQFPFQQLKGQKNNLDDRKIKWLNLLASSVSLGFNFALNNKPGKLNRQGRYVTVF